MTKERIKEILKGIPLADLSEIQASVTPDDYGAFIQP